MTQVNRKYTNETLQQGTSCSFTLAHSHALKTIGRETGLGECSGGNSERLRTVRTSVKSLLPTSVILLSLSYSSPQTLFKVSNLSSLQVKNTHAHQTWLPKASHVKHSQKGAVGSYITRISCFSVTYIKILLYHIALWTIRKCCFFG